MRAMTRNQLAHTTIDKGSTDLQEPEYIGNNKSPEDVKTFGQVATVEEEKTSRRQCGVVDGIC